MSGPTARRAKRCAVTVVAVSLAALPACGRTTPAPPQAASPTTTAPRAVPTTTPPPEPVVPAGDFTPVSRLVEQAIAAPRMPGAVIQIGHGGKIVFRQAFGLRKLPGEPGLDGVPAPAEPMTEDTIFDLASLTKSLATATAVLQLYERGKVGIDEPIQAYLPEFNPADDPRRALVTLRMLLTHTSGLAGDLSRGGPPWGLGAAERDEGIRRALGTPLAFPPGEVFHYSDIGFIILGTLLERITGEPEDVYVQRNVFAPLGMTDTRYLPPAKACGPHRIVGTAVTVDVAAAADDPCPPGSWSTGLLTRIAPTARDEESREDPARNPDYDRLLRGTVHDPTARRMGGVAGSAGVFSTVRDMGRYAQGLLDRLAGRPSTFPLKQSTLELMTTPQQPGHSPEQLAAANEAERAAIAASPDTDSLFAPNYPAIPGQDLRGFGWDIDTALSRPRGRVFPIGSFGGGGFTGTTLWIDPGSNTYVIILANVIHQRGGPPVVTLSGETATLTARALNLYAN